MSELKPCPFCGGEAYIDRESALHFGHTLSGGQGVYAIACTNCEATATWERSMEQAYAAWNQRHAENARLRAALHQCAEYFDDHQEVDTSDGEPVANKEMRLLGVVREALGEK